MSMLNYTAWEQKYVLERIWIANGWNARIFILNKIKDFFNRIFHLRIRNKHAHPASVGVFAFAAGDDDGDVTLHRK